MTYDTGTDRKGLRRGRGTTILKKIGRFEILDEMGRGPMSVDYIVRDPATDRTIVLTVPSPEAIDSPNLLRRFYREARAAGSLKHPNIVSIYDLGVDRGSPYITRELLEGEDLWHILERKKKEGAQSLQTSGTMLEYILQSCRGLGYAHQQGIIHLDVRPGIIFITSKGQVKLTQFVHARLPEAFSPVSDGRSSSSMDYMSPEQVRGDRLDRATDIWSMGCIMYETLTYTTPFQGANANAQMIAIMSQEPKPIRESRPDLPEKLDNVLRQALKKDRSERYRNMEDVVADLEPLVSRMQAGG